MKTRQWILNLAAAGGLAVGFPLFAHDPLAVGPSVCDVPLRAAWTVSIEYVHPAPPGFARPRSTRTVRSGAITHIEVTEESGKVIDKWISGDEMFIRRSDPGEYFSIQKSHPGNWLRENICPGKFPGFEWVSRENFEGERRIFGRECLVFHGKVSEAELGMVVAVGEEAVENRTVDARAFVDAATRLPVALLADGESRMYAFVAPPDGPLVLPDVLARQLEMRRRAWERFSRAAPAP